MSWNLDEQTFRAVIADTVRAPSVHNTQPWRFRLTAESIEVHLDRDRILPASDPTGRAARISCGAAIYNLRLALAVRDAPVSLRLQPEPRMADLLARLSPVAPRPPTPLERRLYGAITLRTTNRQPFADTAVPLAARAALVAAVRDEGGWLDLVLGGPAVDAVATLTREADAMLGRDQAYLAELRAWTRHSPDAADGVSTLAGGPAPKPYELLVRRHSGSDNGTARDYERDPLVGVLGVGGHRPPDEVNAGLVLQRMLLTATDLGLATAIFSQPIDVPAIREQLRLALGRHDAPQILVRIGYAATLVHSGRRPVTAVIDTANGPVWSTKTDDPGVSAR
jgi:nitroreductase